MVDFHGQAEDVQSTLFDQSEQGADQPYVDQTRWKAFKSNLSTIFNFKPQS